MDRKKDESIKILSDNRAAGHLYYLSDRLEAGLVLTGTEVKAARDGKIQLKDAFGEVAGNEAWLMNVHIGQYSHGNIMNHDPTRVRKLLLHKAEIHKLLGKTQQKGLTLIPLRIYFSKRGYAKVELGLAKGKKLYDRRETIKTREAGREVQRAIKERK